MDSLQADFVNLTAENLATEHLCCIIRSKKLHPGIEAKRQWLADRLAEGHVFRKLNEKATVFAEYAPLETAWVPITGDNYYYLYCLWATGEHKGKGYGKALMEYCLADAKAKELPCVFNNWAVFYKGIFQTVNLVLDVENLKRILKK